MTWPPPLPMRFWARPNLGFTNWGGPQVATFRELMQTMLKVIGRRRGIIGLPMALGRLMGATSDALHTLTLGLAPRPITKDQVRNLAVDNVAAPQYPGLADLGITPHIAGRGFCRAICGGFARRANMLTSKPLPAT